MQFWDRMSLIYTSRPTWCLEIQMNLKELIEPIAALAVDAGKAILEVYATDFDDHL